jgi:predicted nuclease with TOPRIM domain
VDELEELRAENEALRAELEELRAEIEELNGDADIDSCHIAGLTAQIKALIAEGDACPNKDAHPLLVREKYTHARTGEVVTKTKAFPLYREAFDAEAERLGISNTEKIRG